MKSRRGRTAAALMLAVAGCASEAPRDRFPTNEHADPGIGEARPLSPHADLVHALSAPSPATADYRIGPGDELKLFVLGQESLSGAVQVGPDGRATFPLAGTVEVAGLDRDAAAERVAGRIARYFEAPPFLTLSVTRYANNKVYVLGRVEKPGAVELTGSGTLLQAIAEAGGLPVREFRAFLARAAIVRGRDEILWIDLIDLLRRGNVGLNVALRNGDVVYIPDSEDTTVFVMGEVHSPGAVPIKVRLNLTQALAQAGGPTEDADLDSIYLVREQSPAVAPRRVSLRHALETGEFTTNLELKSGDVVYVARNGLGDVSYVLRKLQPGLQGVATAAALAK